LHRAFYAATEAIVGELIIVARNGVRCRDEVLILDVGVINVLVGGNLVFVAVDDTISTYCINILVEIVWRIGCSPIDAIGYRVAVPSVIQTVVHRAVGG
jgi:hypothetical protein